MGLTTTARFLFCLRRGEGDVDAATELPVTTATHCFACLLTSTKPMRHVGSDAVIASGTTGACDVITTDFTPGTQNLEEFVTGKIFALAA